MLAPISTQHDHPCCREDDAAADEHCGRSEDEPAKRPFERLLRADRRRQRTAPERAAGVVLRRVADDDADDEEQHGLPAAENPHGGERAERQSDVDDGKDSGCGVSQDCRAGLPRTNSQRTDRDHGGHDDDIGGDVTAADRGTRRENCGAGDDAREMGAKRRGHCRVFHEGERGGDESERKCGDWRQEPDRADQK